MPSLSFNVVEEKVQQILRRFLLEKLVLCTNILQNGSSIDVTWGGNQLGIHSFHDFVTEVQSLVVYSGHVHEAEGKTDSLGSTQLFVVGQGGLVHEV